MASKSTLEANNRWKDKSKDKIAAYRKTPKGRYSAHMFRARRRGIEWDFTFGTWWAMWEPYWDQRGQGRSQYCMCRNGDTGPYSPDNCRIDTNANNARERLVTRGHPKLGCVVDYGSMKAKTSNKVIGVTYAAKDKSWRARIKVKSKEVHLGCYKDWLDAVCARKSAENKHAPAHCQSV